MLPAAGVEHDQIGPSVGVKSADESIRDKLGTDSLVELKALEDYSHDFKHGPNGILEFLKQDDGTSPETKKYITDLQSKI